MPKTTTVGNILLEQALPESARGHYDTLDSKGLKKLLTYIAKEHPEDMSDTLRALTDVSRDTIYFRGRDASLGLADLRMPPELQAYRDSVRSEVKDIMEGFGSAKDKQTRIIELLRKRIGEIPEELLKNLPETNALAMQVRSGARGNKSQLMQTLFGDVLVVDAQDKPVPIPALHGYGEGVTPLEYWAASNGARKGSVSVQFSTAEGGYFGKQMSNIGHRVVVTAKDCGTSRGIPVDANDEDNVGSVLAQDVGPYKAGMIITQNMLGKLGDGKILVRSLVTCEQGDGVCSVCCGVREKNRLPDIGDPVGIVATRSISEPVTQAGLKCLHPDTEVQMVDGSYKPIKEIVPGDTIMGADVNGNTAPTTVLNVWDNGLQKMNYSEWVSADGDEFSLICTDNHKFLALDEKSGLSVLPFSEIDKIKSTDGKLYQKIGVIELIEPVQALDLEVDNKDHLFVSVNGCISSNSKHTGGVAGSDDKQVSGFKEMNQFVQVPENFIGAATLAGNDGTVTSIEEAPAGGWNVKVDEKDYYVPNGRNVIVKVGDKVYEGDMLSDGTPNPAELTQYKGIGEGRRYFVEKYRELLKKNGAAVHRRNIEALARGFINRVEVDDPDGYDGYLMGDVVPYDSFAHDYEPRPTSEEMETSQASGTYLERPVLHYTVGTRITPHIIQDFKERGIDKVLVNKSKPVFGAKVVRARSMLSTDPDWLTRLAGENLKKNLLESARMGASSTPASTSYFPAMANPTEIDKYLGGDPENRGGNYVNVR